MYLSFGGATLILVAPLISLEYGGMFVYNRLPLSFFFLLEDLSLSDTMALYTVCIQTEGGGEERDQQMMD